MDRESGFTSFVVWIGDRAYFKRGSPMGSVEIGRLRCVRDDLIDIARRTGGETFRTTKRGFWILDEDTHKRLVTYCVAVTGMRRRNTLAIEHLKELVTALDSFSLHFWYSESLERFRRGGLRALFRVSSSLRTLYHVR